MKKINLSVLIISLFFSSGCQKENNYYTNTSSELNTNIDSSFQASVSTNPEKEESSSNEVDEQIKYYVFNKQYKIYINPSVQYSNTYVNNLGNEGLHMNDISNTLINLLKSNTNLLVYGNAFIPGKSLTNSIKESNSLKVDYHLAIHSNAGGGKGSEIYHSKTSYNFSKCILDSLNDILPYKTRGLKDGSKSLYEIKSTTASASLLEILFHDEINQANYIINNKYEIAYAIYEGIVSYFLKK